MAFSKDHENGQYTSIPMEHVAPLASESSAEKSTIDPKSKFKDPNKNPDFKIIKLVSQIVLFILKKCWKCGSAIVLSIVIVSYYYGSLFGFLLSCLSLIVLLYQIGDWVLYQPDQPAHSRLYVPQPSAFGLPSESVHISSKDGVKINLVLVKQNQMIFSKVPTILYFHGNAGNVGHRLPIIQALYHLCGYNIVMVEYRGYGHSEGSPSETGLYHDAQAALDYVFQHPGIDHSKIIVFGCSLGGAVAVDLLSHPEYAKKVLFLALENTFTSVPSVARALFSWRFVQKLPSFFYKSQFLSIQKIKNISIPTLFLSGLSDTLIPPAMMQDLFKLSGSIMKRMIAFENGTHNETWQCQGYFTVVTVFCEDVLASHTQGIQQPSSIFLVNSSSCKMYGNEQA